MTVTTMKNDPPLLVLWQFQPETKLGPIGHTVSLGSIWPSLVLYGLLAISYFPVQLWAQPSFMASGHILPSLDSLANSHILNPQASTFVLGLGGLGPLALIIGFGPTLFLGGSWPKWPFLGHLGPLRPLWSVGHNHGPSANESKRGKPTSPQGQVGPKPQLGPPEPILALNPIKTLRTQFWPITPMASGNHQRPPDQLSSSFLLTLRGILPFLHASHTQGCRSGAYMVLYTIMHLF
ncbi:hypothetical protein O181_113314 [Austropuccinia psidii MF-1]|uniref:Uncharacterized protein n=1 Tax=Austropuccinia psidii MF-1 TaxID=1389203 RepID=A0A9Q3K3D3_9BASI|nr:hypothetical protein [Austropuccinia psidii MF-1]